MAEIVGTGDFKYRIVENWAKLPDGWSFKEVAAVAVDSKDNVYCFTRGEHPIIESLLRYREVEKLRSTYGDSLLAEVAADGRIHASFNQTVARTGRLSSDQPNLHNIPIRSDEGRQFRKAFVPAPGHVLLVADYNQIELRCLAHLAEDPGLIAAFMFAFIVSFDELTIALFVTSGQVTTLPKQMWDDALLRVSPALAAVATLMLVFMTALILLSEYFRRRGSANS